jgi:hypothetical protein
MTNPDMSDLQRLTLEKLQVRAQARISRAILDDMKVEILSDLLADQLSMSLRTFMWGNQISCETKERPIPATWWDAFKEAYFPEWLERRFFVRYDTTTIETKFMHVCPHLNIAARDEERFHMQFLTPPDQRYKV